MPGGVNILGANSQLNAPDNPLYVQTVGGSTLYAGNVSTVTTAVPLGSSQEISEVIVQNPAGNSENVLVGNATNQPIVLVPGASINIRVNDIAKVYAKAATNSVDISYLAWDE